MGNQAPQHSKAPHRQETIHLFIYFITLQPWLSNAQQFAIYEYLLALPHNLPFTVYLFIPMIQLDT